MGTPGSSKPCSPSKPQIGNKVLAAKLLMCSPSQEPAEGVALTAHHLFLAAELHALGWH